MRFIRNISKVLICVLLSFESLGQSPVQFLNREITQSQAKQPFIGIRKLTIRRSGPYAGLQTGKFLSLEFGYEFQWNKVTLRKPITHAFHTGFNYNFLRNVLGYDAGYWFKVGRMNLTYGANVIFRTDFDVNTLGLAPVVGFKFWQLHLQTGYNFMGRSAKDMETNTFFVSLRYVFIQNRDWKWSKKEEKKKPKQGVRWL